VTAIGNNLILPVCGKASGSLVKYFNGEMDDMFPVSKFQIVA
jgi:hypothetical protein